MVNYVLEVVFFIFISCLMPVLILKEPMKINKKYVVVFFILHRLTVVAVLVHNICLQVLWLFFFLIMGFIEIVFIFIVSEKTANNNAKMFVICSFLAVFMLSSLSIKRINEGRYYQHVVTYDYEITIKNGEVIANYDDACYEVKEIVKETTKNMKRWNSTYYKGCIKITYECKHPARDNLHSTECKCTDRAICDLCSDYIGEVKNVYEIKY